MPFENINFEYITGFLSNMSAEKLVLQGLMSPFDLFLAHALLNNNKKVLYVTSDEQTALKSQKDFKTLFDIEARVLPSQEISFYSELEKNYYIYNEQIDIFKSRPNIVFAPIRAFLEKFNSIDFYKKNTINIKKNSTLDYSKIPQMLVELGYRRTTQVMDIGEFALRGDILDIYTLSEK